MITTWNYFRLTCIFFQASSYPDIIGNGKYRVVGVRDLWHARPYDSSTPDGKPTLPCDPNSEALTLTFHNGIQITLRTSGTEPKIKYYSEYCASPSETDWAGLEKVECHSLPRKASIYALFLLL